MKKNVFTIANTFLLILLTVSTSIAQNQQADGDFSRIQIKLDMGKNVNRTDLEDYWDINKAFGLSVAFPYLSGALEMGATYTAFDALNEAQPDFEGIHIYAEWMKEFRIGEKITFLAGPRLGIFQMVFDETEEVSSSTFLFEHEISIGLDSQIIYAVSNHVKFHAAANYNSIMSRKSINLLNAGAGISYSFESPDWLVELMK